MFKYDSEQLKNGTIQGNLKQRLVELKEKKKQKKENINEEWKRIQATMNKALELTTPKKTFKKSKPWFDEEYKKEVCRRQQVNEKVLKSLLKEKVREYKKQK